MAADIPIDEMEIDFDEEQDPTLLELQEFQAKLAAESQPDHNDPMNGIEEAPEDGEIDGFSAAPNKVHLRGLDNLTATQVREYAAEFYSMGSFVKLEWIDDTSANLVYETESAAAEALEAFSGDSASEPLQLRTARQSTQLPDSQLSVRLAVESDVKVPGAKDRSRFYLNNPEWDPDNKDRKRRRQDDRYRPNKFLRRGSDSYRPSDGRQPSYPDWDSNKAHRGKGGPFTEDMYDDIPARDTSEPIPSNNEIRPKGNDRRGSHDLMSKTTSGRLRDDRSASPARDGDGRYGFPEPLTRHRSRSPHRRYDRDNQFQRSRTPTDLYDQPRYPRSAFNDARDRSPPHDYSYHDFRDNARQAIYPDRPLTREGRRSRGSSYTPRPSSSGSRLELFPEKLNGPVHRRQDAQDIPSDELAEAIGKYNFGGDSTGGLAYSSSGRRPDFTHDDEPRSRATRAGRNGADIHDRGDLISRSNTAPKSKELFRDRSNNQMASTTSSLGALARGSRGDLFSRVSGAPTVIESGFGRLNADEPQAAVNYEASPDVLPTRIGFSIKGAAKQSKPPVRELLPGRLSVLDGGVAVRGRGRSRAEDFS